MLTQQKKYSLPEVIFKNQKESGSLEKEKFHSRVLDLSFLQNLQRPSNISSH